LGGAYPSAETGSTRRSETATPVEEQGTRMSLPLVQAVTSLHVDTQRNDDFRDVHACLTKHAEMVQSR